MITAQLKGGKLTRFFSIEGGISWTPQRSVGANPASQSGCSLAELDKSGQITKYLLEDLSIEVLGAYVFVG
jgi:hypothetical protein